MLDTRGYESKDLDETISERMYEEVSRLAPEGLDAVLVALRPGRLAGFRLEFLETFIYRMLGSHGSSQVLGREILVVTDVDVIREGKEIELLEDYFNFMKTSGSSDFASFLQQVPPIFYR